MQTSTSLAGLAQQSNVILDGYYYGYFVLFTTFIILFIYLLGKGYSKVSSAAAGIWMMTILALFLRPLGLIDSYVFWMCIFLTPTILFALWLSGIAEMPS